MKKVTSAQELPFILCYTCHKIPKIEIKDMEKVSITCQKCRRTTIEEISKILSGKSKFTQKGSMICSNKKHAPTPAEKFCVGCSQYLCKKCFELHDKNPACLNHKLCVATLDLSSKCDKHNEDLTYYCDKCRYEICDVCLDSHKGHTLISLKELIFDHNIEEIKKKFDQAEEKVNKKNGEILNKALTQLKETIAEMENDYYNNTKDKNFGSIKDLKNYEVKIKEAEAKCKEDNNDLLKFGLIIFNDFVELKGRYNYFSIMNVLKNLRFNFKEIPIEKKTNPNDVLQYFKDFMILPVYEQCLRCEGQKKIPKCKNI